MKRVATQYPGIYYRERQKGRVYEFAYTDSLGKRRFETVPGGLRDAQRALAAVRERMHRGEKVAPSKLTVRELAEDYLRSQTTHLRESTLGRYGYDLDHYVLPVIGGMRVSTVDKLAVQELISGLKGKGLKTWTVRGALVPLSAMFNYAVDRGWAASNPVKQVDKKRTMRSDQAEMRILTTDEIQQLLAAATKTYKLLLTTAIFTGLRLGELLNLRWDDIDLAGGRLRVRESKTAAGVRRVALPPFLVQALATASLDRSEGFVFETKDGDQMKHRRVGRALEETLERAGVPRVRFHDLRHTFASLLIAEGMDVTYVAKQMGHSSPQVTLGVYAKLFDPEQRELEAKERLEVSFAAVIS